MNNYIEFKHKNKILCKSKMPDYKKPMAVLIIGITWKMQFLKEAFHLTRHMEWQHSNIMAQIQDLTRFSIREWLTTQPLPWRKFLRLTKASKAFLPLWMLVVELERSSAWSSPNTLQSKALTSICPMLLTTLHPILVLRILFQTPWSSS